MQLAPELRWPITVQAQKPAALSRVCFLPLAKQKQTIHCALTAAASLSHFRPPNPQTGANKCVRGPIRPLQYWTGAAIAPWCRTGHLDVPDAE